MNAADLTRQFDAVDGYIDLGMLQHAFDLLESLPSEAKRSKPALEAHLRILAKSQEWKKAAILAESMSAMDPQNVSRCLSVSWFLMMGKEYERGLQWLQKHRETCGGEGEYHYNLASCYAGLDDLLPAKQALKRCIELAPHLKLPALDDPQFKKLW